MVDFLVEINKIKESAIWYTRFLLFVRVRVDLYPRSKHEEHNIPIDKFKGDHSYFFFLLQTIRGNTHIYRTKKVVDFV